MKKVFDINDYRAKKEIEKIKEEKKKEMNSNDMLLKELVSKKVKELSDSELEIYSKIQVIFSFKFRDIHSVFVVEFRGQIYLLNFLGDRYEYLGSLEEVLERSLY